MLRVLVTSPVAFMARNMPSGLRRLRGVFLILATLVLSDITPNADAQTPARPSSIRLTVRDLTKLPVAGASVTVTGPDGALLTTITNDRGQAIFATLAPGTYSARVEVPGFDPLDVSGLVARAGATVTRDVELRIAGIVELVDVTPTGEDQALADPLSEQLSAGQIAALPEDPEELTEYLQQLVGDDVDIRVDGFAATLPPGARIEEVRIRYDIGAADGDGRPRIEIRTRPGGDRWRSDAGLRVRDEGLNARNAFSDEPPEGQTRQYEWNLNGPLVKDRTGLSVSVSRSESLEQQAIRAATLDGLLSTLVEQPSTGFNVRARVDHALNASQTVRFEVRRQTNRADNQGVGEFDFPERAFFRENATTELRASHRATIGRSLVNDARFEIELSSSESSSVSDATTIRVLDAFTRGGAQVGGGRRSKEFELEDELKFTWRRRHQMSAGFTVEGTTASGDASRNAIGTFTFASLEAFEAGTPSTFTQRVGDPRFDYSLFRYGWFAQDDFKVRPNLMINLGLRHDFQTHLRDWANFGLRAGLNWTPSKKFRTTLSASAGSFYEEFGADLYQETLVVNGLQQRDLVISNPGFPDPNAGAVALASRPPSIVRARPDIVMPSNVRLRFGVDQPIGSRLRLRGFYTRRTARDLFRSLDVNAPINGVRLDALAGTITQVETSGRSLNQSLELTASLNYRPHRITSSVRYTLGEAWNDADGTLTLPPDSFDLSGQWGPSRQDIRHRLNVSVSSDLFFGFRWNANFRAQSGVPYTVTTGEDTNGDGVNNERPLGFGRNSARMASTQNLDAGLTWGIGTSDGGGQSGGRGQAGARTETPARRTGMLRFEIYARATNVLNTVNPRGYSGVLTSPFFGLPTAASAARRLQFGTRVWF